MKKKVILRGINGFSIGISIGYVLSILSSLIFGDGNFYPCVPELADVMGNEINAVILQTVLCGVIGTVFSASSVIWEIEDWSIAKQTIIYFFITSVFFLPIAYVNHWVEHSLKGFIIYFAIFIIIFFIIWSIAFIINKNTVRKINENLYKFKKK